MKGAGVRRKITTSASVTKFTSAHGCHINVSLQAELGRGVANSKGKHIEGRMFIPEVGSCHR